MLTAFSGPIASWGQTAPVISGQPPASGYNADLGPSTFAIGTMLPDGRFVGGPESTPGSPAFVGIWNGGGLMCVNQAPAAIATANIAALANVASGVAMTLVAASGAGITVTTAVTPVLQTGASIAAGSRVIDLAPATITFGQNLTMQVADPRRNIARAVCIRGSTNATGGAFAIVGYDLYGMPQTETITAGAGAVTTNGAKGWKFITSVTPGFTDAHNYSVGVTDIFEFPVAVYEFCATRIYWDGALITASTGFVAAVTTTPSGTTGSVRGTYAVQSASDATKKLQIYCDIMPWNAASLTGTASVFGQIPA